ncbi:4'-phosphopantetheinyl transferase family protein [Curtobacterium sp. Curtsp57]|uniref:4'-phosphopantetheinyl transferase family protein n=1 Tax=Curtobacterium sp. Curtsp57 TaxID=3243047 RepID=UPI0039B41BDB
MGDPGLQTVSVRVSAPGVTRAADREALLAFVAEVTGADPATVRGGRRCAHCGSTAHGRPWAVVDDRAANTRIVGVSLSRTDGAVALAVGPAALGVDVERVGRVAAARLDAFTAGERARSEGDAALLAVCWAGKEAVLKRDGRGMRVDPGAVDVDVTTGSAVLEGVAQAVSVVRLEEDLVLAVAAAGMPLELEDRR